MTKRKIYILEMTRYRRGDMVLTLENRLSEGGIHALASLIASQATITQLTHGESVVNETNVNNVLDTVQDCLQENGLRTASVDTPSIENADVRVYASNPVYMITLGEQSFVLKFGANPADITKFLADYDIPVAKSLGTFDLNIGGTNHHVSLMPYVEGETLGQVLRSKQQYIRNQTITNYLRQSVTELVKLQQRGLQGEREGHYVLDAVAEDADYFTRRISAVFKDQTLGYLGELLGEKKVGQFEEAADELIQAYSAVNDELVRASLEDAVYYSDHGPNNIVCNEGNVTLLDNDGGKKLLGLLDFVSLTEFGKLNAEHTSFIDYLSREERDDLFHQYLLERKIESTKDEHVKKEIREFIQDHKGRYTNHKNKGTFHSHVDKQELAQANELLQCARLQRHLEYVGYAQRDLSQAPGETKTYSLDERKINELNRQLYHVSKAQDAVSRMRGTKKTGLQSALSRIMNPLRNQRFGDLTLENLQRVYKTDLARSGAA